MPKATTTTDTEDENHFEDFLSKVGFGRWQLPGIITFVLIEILMPIHLLGFPLLSGPLDFRCHRTSTPFDQNLSPAQQGIKYVGDYYNNVCLKGTNSSSALLEASSNTPNSTRRRTALRSCPFIEYDHSIFTATVISDWNLVCERGTWQPFFQMVLHIGAMVGSTVGGQIGDRCGRRSAMRIFSVMNLVVVLVMVAVPNYVLVLIMRFLVGFCNTAMFIPSWTLAMELTPSRHRSLAGMVLGLPFSIAYVVFAGVGYIVRTWQYLLLICASPVLIVIPCSFLMDESARWLVQQGRQWEATKILRKAVKLNKPTTTMPLNDVIQKAATRTATSDGPEQTKKKTLSSVMRDSLSQASSYLRVPAMRTILLVIPPLWFLHHCLYVGIALNANNFTSTDPFLYLALMGVMDGVAILLMTPLATRLGRRIIMLIGLCGGGILYLLEPLVSEDYFWAKWLLVMAGYFLTAGSFQVSFLYTPELFPTEFRSRGQAIAVISGSIGSTGGPVVTNILSQLAWWASSVLFGCFGILAGLLVLLLPETRNRPLPDTLQDVQDRLEKGQIKTRREEAMEKITSEVGGDDDTAQHSDPLCDQSI